MCQSSFLISGSSLGRLKLHQKPRSSLCPLQSRLGRRFCEGGIRWFVDNGRAIRGRLEWPRTTPRFSPTPILISTCKRDLGNPGSHRPATLLTQCRGCSLKTTYTNAVRQEAEYSEISRMCERCSQLGAVDNVPRSDFRGFIPKKALRADRKRFHQPQRRQRRLRFLSVVYSPAFLEGVYFFFFVFGSPPTSTSTHNQSSPNGPNRVDACRMHFDFPFSPRLRSVHAPLTSGGRVEVTEHWDESRACFSPAAGKAS